MPKKINKNSHKPGGTSQNPPKRSGRNGNPPPVTPVPFSKDNQPSNESKKLGWAKKKAGQELAKAILSMGFKGAAKSRTLKNMCQYFGVEPEDLTVEMMAVFSQAKKAIEKSDTSAFNAIMDRAHGKPTQPLSADDGTIKITVRGAKKS